MRDGIGQVGAGQDDMRLAGKDLQHHVQPRTADENPTGEQRKVRRMAGQGGPMKEAMDDELSRHNEGKQMRMQHLEKHYKR